MIECEECENWFHSKCVGKTGSEIKKLENFYCPRCEKQLEKKNSKEVGKKNSCFKRFFFKGGFRS